MKMTILYNILIQLFPVGIFISSFFGNTKAEQWLTGRKDIFDRIRKQLNPNEKRIWIHAASLGEFEQGRPLIEKIRHQYPEYKIFLTFFSPSGYEIRKNYSGADYIFYLPLDTRKNATRFIDLVNPQQVLFIKYEFWYNYLAELKKRGIPVYLCSAIFRDNQVFFAWYGSWFRSMLSLFTWFFVQNEQSKSKLKSIGFSNATVAGDTRFDRVYAIATQSREIETVKSFVGLRNCLIAGSTWQPDEELLSKYINDSSLPIIYIIAPHEIDAAHLERLENSIQKKTILYSEFKNNPLADYQVLIIDNIGMLSSLYRYGKVAYIGGGFGKGIHNILEAATFGLPVVFGPDYHKFQEALDLVKSGGAFSISDFNNMKSLFDTLFTDRKFLKESGNIAETFVKQNVGATDKIISHIVK